MKKYSLSLFVLCSLFWAASASIPGCGFQTSGSPSQTLEDIKKKGTLIVATAGDMPPFNMTGSDEGVVGYEVDLANKLAEFIGVETKFEIMPFSELLGALKENRVHMILSGMTITPERNIDVAFVGPYYVSSKALLTKEKSVVTGKSLKRFNDSRFAFTALKGSTSQKFVETNFPKALLTTAESYSEAVRMVIDGEVHALLADYPICAVSLLRYPEAGFYTDFVKLTYEPLGIAVASGDPHLINWLDNTLAYLKGSGFLEEIENYWFNDLVWLSRLP